MSRRRDDRPTGERLTQGGILLLWLLATVALITIVTNVYFDSGTLGRWLLFVGICAVFLAVSWLFAVNLGKGLEKDKVLALLDTALQHPGKQSVHLGGLKRAADEWMREATVDETVAEPDVFVAGEQIA